MYAVIFSWVFYQTKLMYYIKLDSIFKMAEVKAMTMKVVLVGDSGVGKTTLINKFVTDTFDPNETPTISGGFRK